MMKQVTIEPLAGAGKPSFGKFLLADWKSLTFLHFEVDPKLLQPVIPFALDLFRGRCFASLVAFRMENMRFHRGGTTTRWMTAPIANNHFLNLRVYVVHGGETGIFFVREWLDNRMAVALGPLAFGLPYQFAHVVYDHFDPSKTGRVSDGRGTFGYSGKTDNEAPAEDCSEALDVFLLERYTAFCSMWKPRFFRVRHRPWKVRKIHDVEILDETLIERAFPEWWPSARFVCGHFSEGLDDVWMGRPHFAKL